MHLLVLSAFRQVVVRVGEAGPESQCTFWCSVLSDMAASMPPRASLDGLNAPFGAQCFPTLADAVANLGESVSQCTFWCSVLSDPSACRLGHADRQSQCTFWCSVLSDRSGPRNRRTISCLNAPFGAQCFPTAGRLSGQSSGRTSLNAPFGAQCFPTNM